MCVFGLWKETGGHGPPTQAEFRKKKHNIQLSSQPESFLPWAVSVVHNMIKRFRETEEITAHKRPILAESCESCELWAPGRPALKSCILILQRSLHWLRNTYGSPFPYWLLSVVASTVVITFSQLILIDFFCRYRYLIIRSRVMELGYHVCSYSKVRLTKK